MIEEPAAIVKARNALTDAEQALERHRATWDKETMSNTLEHFAIFDSDGTRHCCVRRNPRYNPVLANAYHDKYVTLEYQVQIAERHLKDVLAYYERIGKVIAIPQNTIRSIRTWFRRIEKATRP